MDYHVKEFFCQSSDDAPRGNFHKVISLNDSAELTWEAVSHMVPQLFKGWYELSKLTPQDRVEFIRDHWLSVLPYHPKASSLLTKFFASLDDIGVYIVQKSFDDPYQAIMVYSLKGDAGFFRGALPATEQDLNALKRSFFGIGFPEDYLKFLTIHNGFSKTTDVTGLTPSLKMVESYENFQERLAMEGPLITSRAVVVDPKTLIPFYESFGMPFFQCFWTEWYPEQEMGNVYYSDLTKTISDIHGYDSVENMAFPTFTDWLLFYMERIE